MIEKCPQLVHQARWARQEAAATRSLIQLLPAEERTAPLVGGRLERKALLWDQLAEETEIYLAEVKGVEVDADPALF